MHKTMYFSENLSIPAFFNTGDLRRGLRCGDFEVAYVAQTPLMLGLRQGLIISRTLDAKVYDLRSEDSFLAPPH